MIGAFTESRHQSHGQANSSLHGGNKVSVAGIELRGRGLMNLNRLAAREIWACICRKRYSSRVRTRNLPMAVVCLVVFCSFPSANHAEVPVYEVTPVESTIKFGVDSSVPIKGTFDKWDASIKFSSSDVRTGVLEIERTA